MDIKDFMRELAERIERTANVRAVFGEPVGEGLNMVIPVAAVSVRGGGGGGSGDNPDRQGKGKGMGLGMKISTSPVGYVKAGPEGWVFEPIVDKNRVVIAGAVVVGLALATIMVGLKVLGRYK